MKILFYLSTVANCFPSACFSCKTSTWHEQCLFRYDTSTSRKQTPSHLLHKNNSSSVLAATLCNKRSVPDSRITGTARNVV